MLIQQCAGGRAEIRIIELLPSVRLGSEDGASCPPPRTARRQFRIFFLKKNSGIFFGQA